MAQLLTATLPGGSGARTTPDSRLSALSVSGPATTTQALSDTFGYAYNPARWTIAVTSSAGGVASAQSITHDALGRITALSSGGLSQRWTYDGNGNLLRAISGATTTRYGYTAAITPNDAASIRLMGLLHTTRYDPGTA